MPDNLWLILGFGSLVVATIFMVFVPRKSKVIALEGWIFIIVRWFHSAVWLVLALSFFMRLIPNESLQGLANPVAA